jgi:hypothetical protein
MGNLGRFLHRWGRMDNVIQFPRLPNLDSADELMDANKGEFKDMLIIGYDMNGNMTAAVTTGLTDGGSLLWLIENFKAALLNGEYAGGE